MLTDLFVQNIDFQTTILSRFDMIFIVRDEHNETRDKVCGTYGLLYELSEICLLDDCETRNEYPHEQAEHQWRRRWQCRW